MLSLWESSSKATETRFYWEHHLRREWESSLLIVPVKVSCKSTSAMWCFGMIWYQGYNRDLDDPKMPQVHNFRLLGRLLKEFPDNLFCDISSMTAFRRIGEPLTTILDEEEWHPRLGTLFCNECAYSCYLSFRYKWMEATTQSHPSTSSSKLRLW